MTQQQKINVVPRGGNGGATGNGGARGDRLGRQGQVSHSGRLADELHLHLASCGGGQTLDRYDREALPGAVLALIRRPRAVAAAALH